jgi:hypothetical protein
MLLCVRGSNFGSGFQYFTSLAKKLDYRIFEFFNRIGPLPTFVDGAANGSSEWSGGHPAKIAGKQVCNIVDPCIVLGTSSALKVERSR